MWRWSHDHAHWQTKNFVKTLSYCNRPMSLQHPWDGNWGGGTSWYCTNQQSSSQNQWGSGRRREGVPDTPPLNNQQQRDRSPQVGLSRCERSPQVGPLSYQQRHKGGAIEAPPYHLPQQQPLSRPYYGSIPYQGGYFYPPQHQQPQQ